jgi:hypothetical protein
VAGALSPQEVVTTLDQQPGRRDDRIISVGAALPVYTAEQLAPSRPDMGSAGS